MVDNSSPIALCFSTYTYTAQHRQLCIHLVPSETLHTHSVPAQVQRSGNTLLQSYALLLRSTPLNEKEKHLQDLAHTSYNHTHTLLLHSY
jgi:hypothetical protein